MNTIKIIMFTLIAAISFFGVLQPSFAAPIPTEMQDCPAGIKRIIEQSNKASIADDPSAQGTIVVGRNADGTPIYSSCTNPAKAIQYLILRIVFLLSGLVSTVFAFATGKSAFLMATAGDNAEKFQEAVGGLVKAVAALFGVIFSYGVIVFILVGLVGVGSTSTSSANTFNVICQNQIVFQIVFGSGTDGSTAVDPCTP